MPETVRPLNFEPADPPFQHSCISPSMISMPAEPTHEYSFKSPPCFEENVGKRSTIYLQHQTPLSASSALLCRTDSTDGYNGVYCNGSRKRCRSKLSAGYFDTPVSVPASAWSNFPLDTSITSSGVNTPAPLVNTTYRLAGGLDTPVLAANASFEQESGSRELNFRTRWSTTHTKQDADTRDITQGPLARERNGKARLSPSSNHTSAETWQKYMFNAAGALAGKVWSFCTAGAFSGFYAGGGQGYDFKPPASSPSSCVIKAAAESIWQDVGKRYSPFTSRHSARPSRLAEDDLMSDASSQEQSPQRPAKRIHTATGNGWVLVPRSSSCHDRPSTFTPSSFMIPPITSQSRRSAIPRPVASRAHSRNSVPSASRPPLVSHAGSPALHSSRPASSAPVHSPSKPPPKGQGQYATVPRDISVLSPGNKKYAAKRQREAREADDSIRKINKQLKAMIREGKEALGTSVSVEDELDEDSVEVEVESDNRDEDEGFVSGGLDCEMKGW